MWENKRNALRCTHGRDKESLERDRFITYLEREGGNVRIVRSAISVPGTERFLYSLFSDNYVKRPWPYVDLLSVTSHNHRCISSIFDEVLITTR